MLVEVLSALLAAAVGVSPVADAGGPHALRPRDVCLVHDPCATEPLYCLVHEDATCNSWREGRICFARHCPPAAPDLPFRAPASSR